FLRQVTALDECVSVITARLDRGLSPPDVLACVPGERWSEERGLNDQSYIVPGAGGVGEVLNNAWV
ncbi:MAG: uracil phosphoribosyltransferase, partial [Planctomycetota bacterium]